MDATNLRLPNIIKRELLEVPITSKDFRFLVYFNVEGQICASPSWKVDYNEQNGEVFLAGRDFGGEFHLSFHEDGEIHVKDHTNPPRDRIVDTIPYVDRYPLKWQNEEGLTSFTLIFPFWSCHLPWPGRDFFKKSKRGIAIEGHEDLCTLIQFYRRSKDREFKPRNPSHFILAEFGLEDNGSFVVTCSWEDMGDLRERSLSNMEKAVSSIRGIPEMSHQEFVPFNIWGDLSDQTDNSKVLIPLYVRNESFVRSDTCS